jgi:phosphoglucosamine mutase
VDRIQGTDGIRRNVRPQTDPSLAGLSPWEAFVERGVITDAFLEGYAYAFARLCLEAVPPSREVVIGWDPRDPAGVFTGAVTRGLRKAGATAAVMGVAPTPAVPMYMAFRGAAAGLMVTASHNPAGQNGVKIFLAPAGLKLLPADDRRLTAAVAALDWDEVAAAEPRGREVDVSAEWREVFAGFHLAECNSWLRAGGRPLADFVLVVDPARGSYSGTAAEILRAYGADIVEVNADEGDGRVNWRSGVADLEGVASISFDDVAAGGRFAEYPALAALDKLAGEYDAALATGESFLAGVIFDADGDRLFLTVYDPTAGEFAVLSGDEVAMLQAGEMARRLGGAGGGRAFVNTVESDLAVAGAATSLGFEAVLKAVGDKWILTEAWRRAAGAGEVGEDAFAFSASLASRFGAAGLLPRARDIPYGVGCEETGHAITFGELVRADGSNVPFAAGNGLKSALNALAAVATLRRELAPGELYGRLRAPFARGYKGNEYVFFTDKERLLAGGPAYEFIAKEVKAALGERVPSLSFKKLEFAEEPDMLYWAGFDGGRHVLGVFCRNSGTEDKSALYVRAAAPRLEAAAALQEELYPKFYAAVKDADDPRSAAELAWLAGGARPKDEEVRRVAEDVERIMSPAGPTPRGAAVAEELRGTKKS